MQAKVGTTKFSLIYNQIRQSALGIQRKRKVARALQETINPKAAAKRKIQRNAIKKDSRKRKDPGLLYVPFFPFFFGEILPISIFLVMAKERSSGLERTNIP